MPQVIMLTMDAITNINTHCDVRMGIPSNVITQKYAYIQMSQETDM